MNKSRVPNKLAIVDNWSLELAAVPLGDASTEIPEEVLEKMLRFSGDVSDPLLETAREDLEFRWGMYVQEGIGSLLQFLDILVIHDQILHGKEWSGAWERFDHFKVVKDVLVPIAIEDLPASEEATEMDSLGESLIGGGAMRYLRIAQQLGVPYWPAPMRAAFLEKTAVAPRPGKFLIGLTNSVNQSLGVMVSEILAAVGSERPPSFPGFGTAILRDCESRSSILRTALEFRESKEARGFRHWLEEMEMALTAGDVHRIAGGVKDLKEVVSELEKSLSLEKAEAVDVKLQVGLSPSVSLGAQGMASLLKWLRPKPLHISFLRQHFNRVLRSVDVRQEIARLFPEAAPVPRAVPRALDSMG